MMQESPAILHRLHIPFLGLLCVLTLVIYALTSVQTGDGSPLMPVDDAYIHFQYARQIARGELYQYNPGQPSTSGATSLLYPYLLAIGSLLGLQDLQLGWWALTIGCAGLFGSALAVTRISRFAGLSADAAMLMGAAFILNGAITWHAYSGMETMLIICLLLWTLWGYLSGQLAVFVAAASLLTITRPEGSIAAVIAVIIYLVELYQRQDLRERRWFERRHLWLLLPILLTGLQPLLNRIFTGSFSPTGNQAKSLLGMIPFEWGEVLRRIAENITRTLTELVTGLGEFGVPYLLPGLVLIALLGVMVWAVRNRRLTFLFLILLWMAALIGAISTLDTALWHFKRYQMPLIALIMALSPFGLTLVQERFRQRLSLGLVGLLAAFGIWSMVQFVGYYAMNTRGVASQPLAMARWLAENTPPDAVVAVHDVGMMRYLGNRTTIDMVGLTTAGAADWWRNGPGAVGEYLTTVEPRPDYVAAYNDARGLSYPAQTSVYGDLLEGFEADYDPRFNVALGGPFQGIYQPTWVGVEAAMQVQSPLMREYVTALQDQVLVNQIDVANLESEQRHRYQWQNQSHVAGFATEFYQQQTLSCADASTCIVTDGGRRLNGEERFSVEVQVGQDALLITRVHPLEAGTLRIHINDQLVAERWIPSIPGQWLEVPTLITSDLITSDTLEIRVVPDGFVYMPYMHWIYQGRYVASEPTAVTNVSFQEGAIRLAFDYTYLSDERRLDGTLSWQVAGAHNDALLFIHVYDDPAHPPVTQMDIRMGQGGLILQNALPGSYQDGFSLNLEALPAGEYTLAIGMYDPVSGQRLQAEATEFTIDESAQRVMIGQIEVSADAR